MKDPVLLAIDDRGVATITLNRPGRLNAINMAMRDLLWEYFRACRDIEDVQAIVFRGEGRAFSAGADISEFGTAPSVMASRSARHDRDLWWELLNHRCLTIALMHGFCYGAGLELPLLCDLRIAERGASFALPEVTLGYIPSACGTQTLPRLAPQGVAMHMILTGEPIGADEALRWGLVDEVVEIGGLDAALERTLARTEREQLSARRRAMVTLAGIPDGSRGSRESR
ncbi:MAG TPA: enoyl-CoA hydratase/isomerase family protein [Tepidiformaceae bacterium]|nr:enoyl-CoA hydratase/isomerase family protein [Tepidiformaceae bacterium]